MEMIGVIINNVSMLQEAKIHEKYSDLLNKKGIKILGIIPQSRILSSPTIGEVLDATAGTLLTEDLSTVKDKIIENFIIGAMQTNDAVKYMRKSQNLGIITGGDRSDLILMSIELGVSLVILTGNLHPDVVTLAKAKEAEIPIILVGTDTYTTASNVQNIKTKIQPGEIEECKIQIVNHIDWKIITN
jgi:BioD-like phosphotransacetylase family protein